MAEKSNQPFDGLPSYSESVSAAFSPTHSLPSNIAQARASLIAPLLSTIKTHLHSNALSGLPRTTLLIIPPDVSSLQAPSTSDSKDTTSSNAAYGEKVVGFPSTENIIVHRLQGQENNLAFWCQPVVISELKQQLCSHLQNDGYSIAGGNDSVVPKSIISNSQKFPAADWRTSTKKSLQSGEATSEVRTQEISVRNENSMGLYETKTGKALVIRVEIG